MTSWNPTELRGAKLSGVYVKLSCHSVHIIKERRCVRCTSFPGVVSTLDPRWSAVFSPVLSHRGSECSGSTHHSISRISPFL